MSTSIENALVGRTIKSYKLAEDGGEIVFNLLGAPPVTLVAYGDCCSCSWIESIDLPSNLKGRVIKVEEVEMPNLGNIDGMRHKGVEEVSYYGLKITTTRGSVVLDYRNDSNGYYGGSLEVKR